jgi:hypothetical protein
MAEGIQLRLTHAQRVLPSPPYEANTVRSASLYIDDIRDTENVRGLVLPPQYVPFETISGSGVPGFSDLDFTSPVARSYETGDIRRLIDQGEVIPRFYVGGALQYGMEGPVVITAVAGAPTPDVHTGLAEESLFLVDTTSDLVTINLPDGDAHPKGIIRVLDVGGNSVTNGITVTPLGADTINGGASYVLSSTNGAAEFVWDAVAANWALTGSMGTTLSNPVATAVTPYTTANGELVEVTTGAGAFTVNLPNPGVVGDRIVVKKVDVGVGVVTVDSNGGPNIDGAATVAINLQWGAVTLVRGTALWLIE